MFSDIYSKRILFFGCVSKRFYSFIYLVYIDRTLHAQKDLLLNIFRQAHTFVNIDAKTCDGSEYDDSAGEDTDDNSGDNDSDDGDNGSGSNGDYDP